MLRHVVRILRSDWGGWAPSMGVVAAVTILVTACTNQFVWISSWTRLGGQVSTAESSRWSR